MAKNIKLEGDESVVLRVSHSNLKTFNSDIRFSLQVHSFLSVFFFGHLISLKKSFFFPRLQLTVEGVKEKLWKKCGTSVNSMHLELYDDTRNKIVDLSDNSKPLGFYSPYDGFVFWVFLKSCVLVWFLNVFFCAGFVCMLWILIQLPFHLVVGSKILHWWKNTKFLKKHIISDKVWK